MGTNPHFCHSACWESHATEEDRAGDEAEVCQSPEHWALWDDSTAEVIAAHVRRHQADRYRLQVRLSGDRGEWAAIEGMSDEFVVALASGDALASLVRFL